MDQNGRFVVGILTSGLRDPFSRDMQIGILQRAEEENVNVVVFPGKFIHREAGGELRYEYQYNTLFRMITEDNIDAVIISADSIGTFADRENIRKFIQYYSEIPCVLIASKEDGKSSITYDNCKGIEEGITYLIEKCGCRKFIMLGGPKSNTDANERRETFLRVLSEHDIPFDMTVNYIEGNLSRTCMKEAEELLEKNPGAEAVFCANDDTAIALYTVMKEKNIIPGQDMYVLGYDNSREAGQIRPTLSSIWADPEELARQSFDMALNLLRGRKTPSRKLDTMFIKRDSFGEDTSHIRLEDMNTDQIKQIYNMVFYRLQGARGVEYKAYQKVVKDCINLIRSVEYAPELHKKLLDDFEAAINTGILLYADMELLQGVLDDIYGQISEGENTRKDRQEVREGYGAVYKMLIAAQEERIRNIMDTDHALDDSLKTVAQDIMQFENGNDLNYSVLLRKLPKMGVRNAYLYMLKSPVDHLEEEIWETPDEVYLKAVLKDGEVSYVTVGRQQISSENLFRNDFIGSDRFSYVMLPLFSNETVYGFLMADLVTQMSENGEILVNQISAAVKMLQVLRNTEDIKTQLEQSLLTLSENNIKLDNMSKEDSMTGIYNRRGFMDSANACLKAAHETDIPIRVMYVDMDNLKIVNDRYGHDAGDLSLKFIAKTLSEKVGDSGTVGRIGGDEFAGLIWNDDDPDKLRADIRKSFDDFNRTSEHEFNISASIGIYAVSEGEQITLEEALSRADENLYEEKKKRSKNPAKVKPE